MSSAASQSLINLLLEGGVPSREEAAQLAQNLNGGSWTTQVLDSGKVDEQRFLAAIGNFFRVPVVTIEAKSIDRQTLSLLPSRLVFQHQIEGSLHEVAVPPQLRLLQSAIISRLKVMAHMDIAERRLPQDGRIQLHTSNQDIDVRVSTIPTVNGESISLRLLSRSEQQFGFDRLDLSEKQQQMIRNLLAQPNGIILVTGPTGCGKST